MTTWTHAPPDDPRGFGLPLIRTPAARSLKAIVTCENLIGTDTHFWGGHTVPCQRPSCDACEAGIAYRWHGYLSAFNPVDQMHFVFEFTAQAADKFMKYFTAHDTLRCCEFEAYRWKHIRNGRVIIKTAHSAFAPHALPAAPDLCRVMAVIWRLPIDSVESDGNRSAGRRPHLAVDDARDGQSSDPLDYAVPLTEPLNEVLGAAMDPNGRHKRKRTLPA